MLSQPSSVVQSPRVTPRGLNPETATIEECVEAIAILLGAIEGEEDKIQQVKKIRVSRSSCDSNKCKVYLADGQENILNGLERDPRGYCTIKALAQHINAYAQQLDARYSPSKSFVTQIGEVQRGVLARGLAFGRAIHGLGRC